MKIIAIGQNYLNHNQEMKNAQPTDPVIFLKPESEILIKNRPFFIPDFSDEIHYEVELIVKINRLGSILLKNMLIDIMLKLV